MRGLVAHVEGEFFLRGVVVGFVEGGGLQAEGAIGEPLMLCDTGDERVLGEGGRGVLFPQGGAQVVVVVRIFVVEDAEGSGEAVGQVVQARCGFSGFGARSGAELRVRSILFLPGWFRLVAVHDRGVLSQGVQSGRRWHVRDGN